MHGSLEIFGLLLLALELGIKMKWLGPRVYFNHPRTVIKVHFISLYSVKKLLIMETLCVKCQILFPEKNKEHISKCCQLKILPRLLSIKQSADYWAFHYKSWLTHYDPNFEEVGRVCCFQLVHPFICLSVHSFIRLYIMLSRPLISLAPCSLRV